MYKNSSNMAAVIVTAHVYRVPSLSYKHSIPYSTHECNEEGTFIDVNCNYNVDMCVSEWKVKQARLPASVLT